EIPHSLDMKFAALVIVALIMSLTGNARAGGDVDWSAYIDKDGKAPLPKQKTVAPVVAEEDDAPKAKPAARAAKTAKSTKTTKAKKTSKAKAAKAKTRAKTKKRRK